MGNTTSREQEDVDPWWHPNRTQNTLQQTEDETIESEKKVMLEQTIQHLAQENMRLSVAKNKQDEEVERMRGEAEKAQQVLEKLHEQIQAGREDRHMITCEMERIRAEFDAERESKDEILAEARRLREERDELRREVQALRKRLTGEEDENPRLHNPEVRAEMVRFQAEMSTRREARQRAVQAVSAEMDRLRTELTTERDLRSQQEEKSAEKLQEVCQENERLQEELQILRSQLEGKNDERIQELSQENQTLLSELELLRSDKEEAIGKIVSGFKQENERLQRELQDLRSHQENSDSLQELSLKNKILQSDLTERTDGIEKLQSQVAALKEVVAISKQMLRIREGQVEQLRQKLNHIEASITSRLNEDLKNEYQSQMENIRRLKGLYEERMKIMLSEKEKLMQDSEEKSQHLEAELKKSAEFEQQLIELRSSLLQKEEEISDLQIQLDDSHDKSKGLANELAHINSLFTQMLVGGTATDMDLDKLTRLLQENRELITEITVKEDSSEAAAALPRLLLDLVTQAGEESPVEQGSAGGMAVNDIAINLPKVWKVLMELLSHHVAPEPTAGDQNSCYKSVDTPSGPRLVISVSKTFLRLKDLILEKKSLQKELTRLKQLNGHLESKLSDQEDKLSLVSGELRKTWDVVDRMQTQHRQLHTHEKILRYELHEKRKMLTELKQELEYCREKWERARQKNSDTELQWRTLRREFASRKKQPQDDLNNSGESGYSDERGDEDSSGEEQVSPADRSDPEDHEPAANAPGTGDCSTISFITLLKQQLAFFSKNLEETDDISWHNQQALDSIFSLPPIQIPNFVGGNITNQDCLQSFYCCRQGNDFEFRSSTPELPRDASSSAFEPELGAMALPKEENSQNTSGSRNVSEENTLPQSSAENDVSQEQRIESTSCSQQSDDRFLPETPKCMKSDQNNVKPNRTPEQIAEARAARLKRLEEQCQQLFNKVTRTTHRSTALCNRLEELHEQYRSSTSSPVSRTDSCGDSPVTTPSPLPFPQPETDRIPPPPPFPHNLRPMRIPTCLEETSRMERLPSCSQSNVSAEQQNTTQNTIETTTQRISDTSQRQDEISQDSTKSSDTTDSKTQS
ncbi:myosin-10 [Periplaneta americana]|uniref:myosin-10 n=1 Tax=Periplaneta americana TaxID=6978 RepID=UPI0037E7AE39